MYHRYGGRGIHVCDEWHDPWTFYRYLDEHLGPCPPRHSLDRINNDGNYEPDNVRWATFSEQARNGDHGIKGEQHPHAKLTDTDVLAIRGAGRVTQRELAEQYGVSRAAIGHIITRKTWRHI
jgi:hypothetical protein